MTHVRCSCILCVLAVSCGTIRPIRAQYLISKIGPVVSEILCLSKKNKSWYLQMWDKNKGIWERGQFRRAWRRFMHLCPKPGTDHQVVPGNSPVEQLLYWSPKDPDTHSSSNRPLQVTALPEPTRAAPWRALMYYFNFTRNSVCALAWGWE